MTSLKHRLTRNIALVSFLLASGAIYAADVFEYRVLATKKTSTMEKELNEAAAAGYEFRSVMGGETANGGDEVVVVMGKSAVAGEHKRYRLLATSKTSTMQKELNQLGEEGFEYRGQTVFSSAFGGREVAVILERDTTQPARRIEYKLLATSKTSTMDKELNEAGKDGYNLAAVTVGKTAMGGTELVSILWRTGK